jgi:hypothetical protein
MRDSGKAEDLVHLPAFRNSVQDDGERNIGGRRRLVLDYDRLAELDESGLTMREIAAEMGVSPAFVCRALRARQRLPAPSFGD